MCGRYVFDQSIIERIEEDLGLSRGFLVYPYTQDICPTMEAPVLFGENIKQAGCMRWGYTVHDRLVINARRETAAERMSFAEDLAQRRCILPASAFYEWDTQKRKRIFTNSEKSVLYMAGIYHQDQEGKFVILTGEANSSMRPYHDRMPLLLDKNEVRSWLDPSRYISILRKDLPNVETEKTAEQISLF